MPKVTLADFEEGQEYIIRTRLGRQRLLREHRLGYLGSFPVNGEPFLAFNALPIMRNVHFYLSTIVSVVCVSNKAVKKRTADKHSDTLRYTGRVIH